MDKKLAAIGIFLMFSAIGFSGCNEKENEIEESTNEIEEYSFLGRWESEDLEDRYLFEESVYYMYVDMSDAGWGEQRFTFSYSIIESWNPSSGYLNVHAEISLGASYSIYYEFIDKDTLKLTWPTNHGGDTKIIYRN
jgi:hypothetical protein